MTAKDKKIIEDAEKQGIPIFVLTAKDKVSLDTIIAYRDACEEICSNEHYRGIEARIDEFAEWQELNFDKVKIPD